MAQLQFRSDDTIKWIEQYGNFSDGDEAISGEFSNPKTPFTGTEATKTGVVGSESGFAIGDIVLIHQSREGGDAAGDWQLNKITNIVGTTFTFKYNLTHDYATTAQIIKVKQNRNISINGSLSAPAWDGSVGGIIVLMGDSVTLTSNINGQGANGTNSTSQRPLGGGYRGGQQNNDQHTTGHRGEGINSVGNDESTSANGNAAGGGSSPSGTNKSHGGGGGNATAGVAGNNGAQPGSIVGNAQLTVILFGGAGSSGSGGDNSNAGSGANGGAIVIIIARVINLTAGIVSVNGGVSVEGTVGQGRSYGGNGAAGSILLKGEKVSIGSAVTANGGIGGDGGQGGNGYVHVDYAISLTGASSPVASSRIDKSLIRLRTPAGLFMFLQKFQSR